MGRIEERLGVMEDGFVMGADRDSRRGFGMGFGRDAGDGFGGGFERDFGWDDDDDLGWSKARQAGQADLEEDGGAEEQDGRPVKKKRKRRKKRYLLKFLLFCAVVALTYYFVNSSFFDVQNIEVEDNRHYTSEQIIQKAGARVGENIFRVGLGGMKSGLLADPYIFSARIKRQLPSTLVINVVEREEAAFIKDGKYVIIVDGNGFVLKKSETAPLLTELSNLTIATAEEGQALEVEQNAAFADALTLMKEAEAGELYFKRIEVSNIIVRAYVYDHLICEGTPDNLIRNMAQMKGVLEELDQQGIQRGTVKVGADRYIAWQPAEE